MNNIVGLAVVEKIDLVQKIIMQDGSFDDFVDCLIGIDRDFVVVGILKRASQNELLSMKIKKSSNSYLGYNYWFSLDSVG